MASRIVWVNPRAAAPGFEQPTLLEWLGPLGLESERERLAAILDEELALDRPDGA